MSKEKPTAIEIEEESLLRLVVDRKHLREQVQYLMERGTQLLDQFRERLGGMPLKVECKLTRDAAGALVLPRHQTRGAAGLDLQAAEVAAIRPGGKLQIKTGLSVAIPEGFVGKIAAWGRLPDSKRFQAIADERKRFFREATVGRQLHCLGLTEQPPYEPRHPLMLASSTPLTRWS